MYIDFQGKIDNMPLLLDKAKNNKPLIYYFDLKPVFSYNSGL